MEIAMDTSIVDALPKNVFVLFLSRHAVLKKKIRHGKMLRRIAAFPTKLQVWQG
jgi:hypothetical protein